MATKLKEYTINVTMGVGQDFDLTDPNFGFTDNGPTVTAWDFPNGVKQNFLGGDYFRFYRPSYEVYLQLEDTAATRKLHFQVTGFDMDLNHLVSKYDVYLKALGTDFVYKVPFQGVAGIDVFVGSGKSETFYGNADNDRLHGNGGNDTLLGGTGNDYLTGGSGNDTLKGGDGNDRLWGGSGNDKLYGEAGTDIIDGGTGSDVISGGSGKDILRGSAGADDLYGGADADIFQFKSPSDSTVAAAGLDTIFDFSLSGGDMIDLRSIDANTTLSGNQAFSYIGNASFHGIKGELRISLGASDTYVYGDTNGDKKIDFAIHLDDRLALTKYDFLL